MFKEKFLLLSVNKDKYSVFQDKLRTYFDTMSVFFGRNEIEQVIKKECDNNNLLIIFVEYVDIQFISTYLDTITDPFNYILISYSYDNQTDIHKYKNIFDSLIVETKTLNLDFFSRKLQSEISSRKKIGMLQNEVKEFYEIGKSLTSEKNTIKLLEMIINSSISLTSSDAGTMYLVIDKRSGKWSSIKNNDYNNKLLKFAIAKNMSINIQLEESTSPITKESIFGYTIITGKSIRIDDAYQLDPNLEYTHNHTYDQEVGYRTVSLLSIPMKDYEDNIMGVIQLINKKKNKNEIMDYNNKSALNKIIPYDYTDELIMNSLAGQAAVALENNLLYEGMNKLLHDYKQQNEQLSLLSRKILKAHEEERKRIAREIHDGAAQSAANLSLKLEICKKFFNMNEYAKVMDEINDLKSDVNSTIKEIRTIIYDLKPSYLEGGLIPALENRLKIFKDSTNINVNLKAKGDNKSLEYYISSTVYRIIQEALSNIYKHANAKNVKINLDIIKSKISFNITDDGKGFEMEELGSKKRELEGGFGLEGIKERVELVKGDVEIKSAPGKGTEISVSIPL